MIKNSREQEKDIVPVSNARPQRAKRLEWA